MTHMSSTKRDSRFSQILSRSKTFTAALLLGAQSLACGAAPAANEVEGDEVDCLTDADCPAGQTCTEEFVCESSACNSEADCPTGATCSADGYCFYGSEKDGSEPAPVCDPTAMCVTGNDDIENQTPTIMLLIDQSGSMEESFGDTSRWLALRDALVDPNTGIIANMQEDVRFGVAMFSGDDAAAQCPNLIGLDSIQVDFGNYEQIAEVYNAASPLNDTPTGESLAAVTDYLLNLDVPGPKAIVLATDGEPDTCNDPDAHNQDTNDFVVATAQATYGAGISTYVLSVGDDVGTPHLEDLANAGAGYEVDGDEQAPYFQANDQAELQDELSRIVSGIRSCIVQLNGDVPESVVADGVIRVDDRELEYGVDWQLLTSNQVQLIGEACAATSVGEHTVTADFPCECEENPVDPNQFVH